MTDAPPMSSKQSLVFTLENKFSASDEGNTSTTSIVHEQGGKFSTLPIIAPTSNYPVPCTCPYCHQSIVTRVEKRSGALVWLAATGICLLGCALGCCFIPFFIDDMKDTTHYCPNCSRMLGQNKKL